MKADFSQCAGWGPEDPLCFALEVPVGASSFRVMMDRKDAEELMAQIVFILGYKLELTS